MNDTPASPQAARIRADRDRFVAMSFCWADILLECDSDEKIVFAVGPTAPLTGKSFSDLIGVPLQEIVDQLGSALTRLSNGEGFCQER